MAIAIIAGSLVLITGFRFAVTEPGPLYLVPAVLAGFWLGIRPALIVAAAGNHGNATRFYPAAYERVLAVVHDEDLRPALSQPTCPSVAFVDDP